MMIEFPADTDCSFRDAEPVTGVRHSFSALPDRSRLRVSNTQSLR